MPALLSLLNKGRVVRYRRVNLIWTADEFGGVHAEVEGDLRFTTRKTFTFDATKILFRLDGVEMKGTESLKKAITVRAGETATVSFNPYVASLTPVQYQRAT